MPRFNRTGLMPDWCVIYGRTESWPYTQVLQGTNPRTGRFCAATVYSRAGGRRTDPDTVDRKLIRPLSAFLKRRLSVRDPLHEARITVVWPAPPRRPRRLRRYASGPTVRHFGNVEHPAKAPCFPLTRRMRPVPQVGQALSSATGVTRRTPGAWSVDSIGRLKSQRG